MGTFRGYICNSIGEYNAKKDLIHSIGQGKNGYNSPAYCGVNGVANVYTVDGKPILIEPKIIGNENDTRNNWVREARASIISFVDLDTSIIKVNEI